MLFYSSRASDLLSAIIASPSTNFPEVINIFRGLSYSIHIVDRVAVNSFVQEWSVPETDFHLRSGCSLYRLRYSLVMSTLSNSFPKQSDSTAVIIPGKSALAFSFTQLNGHISSFQQKLASLGIANGSAVSIALPNSFEFIVRGHQGSQQASVT